MALDLPQLPDLTAELWRLLDQVPAGRVTTYGRLADGLGDRVAARWVGQEMLHHAHTKDCRCYRVVRADGDVGAFVLDDQEAKPALLRAEGVRVNSRRIDLDQLGFVDFESSRPLAALRTYQESLRERFSNEAPPDRVRLIGAVDVSYGKDDAVAAYTLFDYSAPKDAALEPVFVTTLRRPIHFPYISSYLAFRELPVLLQLLDEARAANATADVVLVDGSGILHPRRTGIATMLGIVADIPTIGVTKKLLCGSVDVKGLAPAECRPVLLDEEPHGFAMGPASGSNKPLYVSPGHRANVPWCRTVIDQIISRETADQHRLLEPIYHADRLSRAATKS